MPLTFAQSWLSAIQHKENSMTATIYDIAKKCHCSTTTVSKVLNNTGNISPQKTKEILKVAKELGYMRSHSARSLASSNHSSNLIGVYLHINEDQSITHELFSKIINSFRIEVEKSGYDICFIRNISDEEKYSYESLLMSRGIDGALILSTQTITNKLNELVKSDIPLVTFDVINSKYCISSNNEQSVINMVDYLVSLGHERICYVCPEKSGVSEDRKNGFIKGLKKNNIPFDERMIVNGPYFGKDSALIATENALSSGINPTVIMYPDDYTAISAIPILRKKGYHVPRDMSITGFDGVDIGAVMRPSLVTTVQNTAEIGKNAAKLLLKQINNNEIEEKNIIIPTSLFKGESVSRINKEDNSHES